MQKYKLGRAQRSEVRLGSKPEVARAERHVRSTPRSRHCPATTACPKRANSRSHRGDCRLDQHRSLRPCSTLRLVPDTSLVQPLSVALYLGAAI